MSKHRTGKVIKTSICDCDPDYSYFNSEVKIGHTYHKFDITNIVAASIECPRCKKLYDKVMVAEQNYEEGGFIPIDMVKIDGFDYEFQSLSDNYGLFKECHQGNHDNTEPAFMAGALFIMNALRGGREAAHNDRESMHFWSATLNIHENTLLRYGMEMAGMSPADAAAKISHSVDIQVPHGDDTGVDIGAHIKSIIDKLKEGESGRRSVTPKPSTTESESDGGSFAT